MFAWIFFFFFNSPYPLLDTLVLSCSGPFICTLEFFSCKFVQWKILFSLDRKHGEFKKKKQIQIEEIYFCVKLFKNSVLYKRQKVLCTWCEYANTAIIKIDCMEKSLSRFFFYYYHTGSDSSSRQYRDWEMCLLFHVSYGWVGRSYLYENLFVAIVPGKHLLPGTSCTPVVGTASVQCWTLGPDCSPAVALLKCVQ